MIMAKREKGAPVIVTRNPTTSSITILPESFSLKIDSARPETQQEKMVNGMSSNIYKGIGSLPSRRKRGMAATVPTVPEAIGLYPVPHHVENRMTKRLIGRL